MWGQDKWVRLQDKKDKIMTNYSINPDYYMVVTRVNPVCRSWGHLPHTKGDMWIFPMYHKLLEFNLMNYSKKLERTITPEEKEEINKHIYNVKVMEDMDTYVWCDIVKKKKIAKLTKPDEEICPGLCECVALFNMIYSLHNFNVLAIHAERITYDWRREEDVLSCCFCNLTELVF